MAAAWGCEPLAGRADTMAAMDSFLITVDGSEHEVSTGTVRRLLDTSARFWLDLADMDESTADALLRDIFGFHPLAVQDAEHFGQRPKIDAYDDFTPDGGLRRDRQRQAGRGALLLYRELPAHNPPRCMPGADEYEPAAQKPRSRQVAEFWNPTGS